MSQEIPWSRTLGARLGGIALVLLAVSLLLVGASFYTLSSLQGDAASLSLYTRGQMYSYQILYYVQILASQDTEEVKGAREELERVIGAMDQRFLALAEGDPGQGVPPIGEQDI